MTTATPRGYCGYIPMAPMSAGRRRAMLDAMARERGILAFSAGPSRRQWKAGVRRWARDAGITIREARGSVRRSKG